MSNPTELPDLDRLEALARAATPQNLDSAQDATKPTGYIECPECGGDGTVDLTADYCNYDGKAMGVQFYGIGPEHQAAEAFFRAANPTAVLALIALARRAQPEGEDLSVEADAYMSACDEMERWQKKRAKAGLEIGTQGSLVDGIAWLYAHIEKLELGKPEGEAPQAGLRLAIADLPLPDGSKERQHGFVDCKSAVLDLLPPTAQPEGEAPQAVYQMRNRAKGGPWQETDADRATCLKRMPQWADLYEFRTLYVAATLSPLCGAPVAMAAQALLDCCDGLPIDTDEATTAALTAFDRTRASLRKALAAQSQGAPAHCDPAKGFCAACREQERAARAEAQAPAAPDAFMVVLGGGEPVSLHFQRVNAAAKLREWEGSGEIVPLFAAQQAAAPGATIDTPEFRELLSWVVKQVGEPQKSWHLKRLISHIDIRTASSAPGTPEAPKDDRKGIELWRATLRACGELPEGYEVRIELENGCGMAVWYDAEGERHLIDGDGHLSDDVNEAVDAAIQRAAQLDGGQEGSDKA